MRLGVEAALVDGALVPGDVEIADGYVARAGISSADGRGLAAPGFVDLQVNGFAGVDFLGADADGYARAGEALLETGVTSFVPTLTTAPEAELSSALCEVPSSASGARILGVHLEGPFISPLRLGAHPPLGRCDPDPDLMTRLLKAGPVRLVTLAPELPGAGALIQLLVERGIVVSCGHSDATAEEADAAFELGARTVTHLFNAMRPFHHRDASLAGAALARDDVVVQLVLDNVHVSPTAARIVWRAAAGRVALVTDAIAGAGLGDGTFRLGGIDVVVKEGIARTREGALAGSTLTMDEAVRNLHALGVPIEDAIGAATAVPAGVLSHASAGRLAPGLPADVVVLDSELEVERVLVGGAVRFAR